MKKGIGFFLKQFVVTTVFVVLVVCGLYPRNVVAAGGFVVGGPGTCTVDILGVSADSAVAHMIAMYTLEKYRCEPGTYLHVADGEAYCADCPIGSYCPGGDFTIEDTYLGQKLCPDRYTTRGIKSISELDCILDCDENCSGQDCISCVPAETDKFIAITPIMSEGDVFQFEISAAGDYTIDWGDGTSETITKDVESIMYSHVYNKYGQYTVKISGVSTGYSQELPAISFQCKNDKGRALTPRPLVGVGGSLGAVFSTLEDGSQPLFYKTFYGCNAINNTSLPEEFFEGISGAPVKNMFAYTFYECTGLQTLPHKLFAGLSGAPAESMFEYTFAHTNVSQFLTDLFSGIRGKPAARMFNGTFSNTNIKELPSDLFVGITGDENEPVGEYMFANTFEYTLIESIPDSLFKNVKGTPNKGMFYNTFAHTKITSIPANLFAGVRGAPAESMFAYTFAHTDITSIPPELFSRISGAPAESMFASTFEDCSQLDEKLSAKLFENISGNPVNAMFMNTFKGAPLTGYIPYNMFAKIDSANFVPGQMKDVFLDTTLDEICPVDTMNYITGFEADFTSKVACIPCPANSSTRGLTGQSYCVCDAGFTLGGVSTGSTTVTRDEKCDVARYKVTYSCETGSTGLPPAEQFVEYGQLFTVAKNATCGFARSEFAGWEVEDSNGIIKYVGDGTETFEWKFTEDKVFHAVYNFVGPTIVTFDGNGGSGGMVGKKADFRYNEALPVILPEPPTLGGHVFVGWYLEKIEGVPTEQVAYYFADGTPNPEIIWKQLSETATLYAAWAPADFTITYSCGEGTGTPPETQTVTFGQEYTVADNTCAKTGYDFDGWVVSNTTQEYVLYPGKSTYEFWEDKTFTARYTPKCIEITLDFRGGIGGLPTKIYKWADLGPSYSDSECSIPISELINLPEPPGTKKLFRGFYSVNDRCIDQLGNISNRCTINSPTTWNATYGCIRGYTGTDCDIPEAHYLIYECGDYNGDGNPDVNPEYIEPDGSVRTQPVEYMGTYVVWDDICERPGYLVNRYLWGNILDHNEYLYLNTEYTFTALFNPTLIAEYSIAHTLSYDCGEGSGTPPESDVVAFSKLFTTRANTCTPPVGKKFDYWMVVSDEFDDIYPENYTTHYPYDTDMTFRAVYTAKQYTISYDCNGGTGNPPDGQLVYHNGEYSPAENTCVRDGYTFDGWMVDGDTEDLKYPDQTYTYTYTTNKVFFAKWAPACSRVILNATANGGSHTNNSTSYIYKISGQSEIYSDEFCTQQIRSISGLPVKKNATFIGFYNNSSLSEGTECINSFGNILTNSECNIEGASIWYARYSCNEGYQDSGIIISGICRHASEPDDPLCEDGYCIYYQCDGNISTEYAILVENAGYGNSSYIVSDVCGKCVDYYKVYNAETKELIDGDKSSDNIPGANIAYPYSDSTIFVAEYAPGCGGGGSGGGSGGEEVVSGGSFQLHVETIEADETFIIEIAAAGKFKIDWGDGYSEIIDRENLVYYMPYDHLYKQSGNYIVTITGLATDYDNSDTAFRVLCDPSARWDAVGLTAVTGAMGSVFPTLSNGKQPSFQGTFRSCHQLQSVDSALFHGITGQPIPYMFEGTFDNTALKEIPDGLFSGLSGTPVDGLFFGTFRDTKVENIPQDLFNGITGAPVYRLFFETFARAKIKYIPSGIFDGITGAPAEYMFYGTFLDTPLNSIPSDLFKNIKGAPAAYMFAFTFAYTHITSIPDGLFAGITKPAAPYMFDSTFASATGIREIPSGLFGSDFGGEPAKAMFASTFENTRIDAIPAGLFSGFVGAPADRMFFATFKDTQITEIPSGLFKNIKGAPAAHMFARTFEACRSLYGQIPEDLFSGIEGDLQEKSFYRTFHGTISKLYIDNIHNFLPPKLFDKTKINPDSVTRSNNAMRDIFQDSNLRGIYNTDYAKCPKDTRRVYTGFDSWFNTKTRTTYDWNDSLNGGIKRACVACPEHSNQREAAEDKCECDIGYTRKKDGGWSGVEGDNLIDGNPDKDTCYPVTWDIIYDCDDNGDGDYQETVRYREPYEIKVNNNPFDGGNGPKCSTKYGKVIGWTVDTKGNDCDKYNCSIDFKPGQGIHSWEYVFERQKITLRAIYESEFEIDIDTNEDDYKVSIYIAGDGRFIINWGDGSRQRIADPWSAAGWKYTHTYKETGVYTISISGEATKYANMDDNWYYPSVIKFFHTKGPEIELPIDAIAIRGSLGDIFPTLSDGTQPKFEDIFKDIDTLSSNVPEYLFSGTPYENGTFPVHGKVRDRMFASAFKNTKIKNIPANLFSSVSGTAEGLFYGTFYNCTEIKSIPVNIFKTITGEQKANMFRETFYNCINTKGSLPVFGSLVGVEGQPAHHMFALTFTGCTNLEGPLPEGYFKNVSGAPGDGMFSNTFYGCRSLRGELTSDLFGGLYGAPTAGLFNETFEKCPSLEGSIPGDLFAGIAGDIQASTFERTFDGCTGLTGDIPNDLFAKISGTPQYSMFDGTFAGSANLTGEIGAEFFGTISGEPAEGMFAYTFDRTSITSISGDLFKNIQGPPKRSMFRATFRDTNITKIPNGLFSGISGKVQNDMFNETFAGCGYVASQIPEDLFAGIKGDVVDKAVFREAFSSISNKVTMQLTSTEPAGYWGRYADGTYNFIPPKLFDNISGEKCNDWWGIFLNSNMALGCPGTHRQYITGFEDCFDGRVACEICPDYAKQNPTESTECICHNGYGAVKEGTEYATPSCLNDNYKIVKDGQICAPVRHKISYKCNSPYSTGDGFEEYATFEMTYADMKDGACVPSVPNYKFVGWKHEGESDTIIYKPGDSLDLRNNCEKEIKLFAQYDLSGEFQIDTTDDTDKFAITIAAGGNFAIDWGDNTTDKVAEPWKSGWIYAHNYDKPGKYTITISGDATSYPNLDDNVGINSVINFYRADNVNGQYYSVDNIAEIRGSLGDVFPTLSDGTQPKFQGVFKNATNLSSAIPANLFIGTRGETGQYSVHGKVRDNMFAEAFMNNKLITEIPMNLFVGLYGTANGVFENTFKDCVQLSKLPSALFYYIFDLYNEKTPTNSMFKGTFAGCSSIETLPSLLFHTGLTAGDGLFASTFEGCTSLNSISADLFDVSGTAPDLFNSTFKGCSSLDKIPTGLFKNVTGIPYARMFKSTFEDCSGLDGEIPNGLFPSGLTGEDTNAPAKELFAHTFYNCSGLDGEIPENLFGGVNKPAWAMFDRTFHNCTNLSKIPDNLFANIKGDTQEWMFNGTFANCKKLTQSIPGGLFAGISGKPVKNIFTDTFANSGVDGFVPITLFKNITSKDYKSGPMLNVFEGTRMATQCPVNMRQYLTGFEVDFSKKVACVDCQANSAQNPKDATKCLCDEGYLEAKDNKGNPTCYLCPANSESISSRDRCRCKPGYYNPSNNTDLTIATDCEPGKYTATFKCYAYEDEGDEQTVMFGEQYDLPPSGKCVKENFVQIGWYTEDDAADIKFFPERPVWDYTFNKTFLPYWSFDGLTPVVLDSNGVTYLALPTRMYTNNGATEWYTDVNGQNRITTLQQLPHKHGAIYTGFTLEKNADISTPRIIDTEGNLLSGNISGDKTVTLYAQYSDCVCNITDPTVTECETYVDTKSTANYCSFKIQCAEGYYPVHTLVEMGTGVYTYEAGADACTRLPSYTFTLDSNYYADASSEAQSPMVSANPDTIYYWSDTGWYSDAENTNKITKLVTIPKYKDNYTFKGFYTSQFADANDSRGTQMIDASGNILTRFSGSISDATLYAYYEPEVYNVTYSCGEGATGTPPDSVTVEYNSRFRIAQNKSCDKDNLTFIGWKLSNDSGPLRDPGTVFTWTYTEDKTFVAQYADYYYTISYEANNERAAGNPPSAPVKCAPNRPCILPDNTFTVLGNTFVGWTCSGQNFCDGEAIFQPGTDLQDKGMSHTDHVTFYAQWKNSEFNVSYDANGGTGKTPSLTSCAYGQTCIVPKNPYNKAGSTFKNWEYRTNNGNTGLFKAGDNLDSLFDENPSDVTLTAIWYQTQANFVYDGNGGTQVVDPIEPTRCLYNSSCSAPENPYVYPGYTFIGWSCSGHTFCDYGLFQPGTDLSENIVKTITDGETITIKANWKPNNFTVIYHGNGAAGEMAPSVFTYGEEAKLSKNAFVAPTGLKFIGWATSPKGEKVYEDEGIINNQPTEPDAVIDLYAVWLGNTYTVTYNANGGTGTMEPSIFVYNRAAALRTNTFERVQYKFKGWSLTEGGDVEYLNGEIVLNLTDEDGGNVDLYAVWEPNSVIFVYDGNGGTQVVDPIEPSICYVDQPCVAPENPYEYKGYNFIGWTCSGHTFCDYGLFQPGTDWAKNIVKTITDGETITIKANWKPISYTVTYNSNGGTGEMAIDTFTYDVAQNLTENGFEAPAGYTFAGWSTEPDGRAEYYDGESVLNLTAIDGENINLYAVWGENEFTITLDADGGTTMQTSVKVVQYGAIPNVEVPVREDYFFMGYYTGKSGTGEMFFDYTGEPAAKTYELDTDITVYAFWKAMQCTDHNGVVLEMCGMPVLSVQEMIDKKVLVKDSQQYKIKDFETYITNQKWSVNFAKYGTISGSAFCGTMDNIADDEITVVNSISDTADAGCWCQVGTTAADKFWVAAGKYDELEDWMDRTDECRAKCPAFCAQLVASDSEFRSKIYGSASECPEGTKATRTCCDGEFLTENGTYEKCPKGTWCQNCQMNECDADAMYTTTEGATSPNACGTYLHVGEDHTIFMRPNAKVTERALCVQKGNKTFHANMSTVKPQDKKGKHLKTKIGELIYYIYDNLLI